MRQAKGRGLSERLCKVLITQCLHRILMWWCFIHQHVGQPTGMRVLGALFHLLFLIGSLPP